ncbi:MAG TPA: ribbon-helix-helix protein, CopG family [Acidimicrobiales bacterium]|nr:ribbon-helix-helix protein, CopG family [Acidimicrobiales bacterium]
MTIPVMARVDDRLVAAVDELVEAGTLSSRSEAVRIGLEALVDRLRRAAAGEQIVAAYRAQPPDHDLDAWAEQAGRAMIEDEPW